MILRTSQYHHTRGDRATQTLSKITNTRKLYGFTTKHSEQTVNKSYNWKVRTWASNRQSKVIVQIAQMQILFTMEMSSQSYNIKQRTELRCISLGVFAVFFFFLSIIVEVSPQKLILTLNEDLTRAGYQHDTQILITEQHLRLLTNFPYVPSLK